MLAHVPLQRRAEKQRGQVIDCKQRYGWLLKS
jgi:hypothetical protein